jgi:signal peptidase I
VEDGDWILTERVSYWFRDPRRWEVVRFDNSEATPVMKRVVGLPHETVGIGRDTIIIDGEILERPRSTAQVRYYAYGNVSNGQRVDCGEAYYVLGDDSRDSWDSRFEGPVPKAKIAGRVWLRVWPLSRIGSVASFW